MRYSYTSSIQSPKQVLKGGYLSWVTQDDNELWQANYFGNSISYKLLGTYQQKIEWRELVDGITSHNYGIKKKKENKN